MKDDSRSFEEKIDDYIAEKYGEEIESKLSSINFNTMVMLSLYWTGFVGFCLVLVFGGMYLKERKKLGHPKVQAIVIESVSKAEKEGEYALFYPRIEYSVDEKKYTKLLSRGWGSTWNPGEKITVEYIEGLPESAESELYPGLQTKISNIETVLLIAFVLFLFPFFMRMFLKWNAKASRKKELLNEYRNIAIEKIRNDS